jgi:ABC-type multidrug transport system fused ATPase/permease subunit
MSDIKEVIKLFKFAGQVRSFIFLTLLRCPFDALYTAYQACFLQYAFSALDDLSKKELYNACIMFGIGSLLLFLYNGTMWTIYSTYVTKWVGRIRRSLFEHISALSLQQIEERPTGEWITRLNADVEAATAILNKAIHLPHAVVALVNICVMSLILLILYPGIYALILAFMIPHLLITKAFIAGPTARNAMKLQELISTNTTDMNALITCAETAILYDAQGFLLNNFEESSKKIRKANMKIIHRRAIENGLIPLMGLGGYLLILLVSGNLIIAGTMTFGSLTAAFQYRAGMQKSMNMLVDSITNISKSLAGIKRVNETMSIRAEEEEWMNN